MKDEKLEAIELEALTPERLREVLRTELRIQQREFAELFGVTPVSVNRWLKGSHPVPAWVSRTVHMLRCMKAHVGTRKLAQDGLDILARR